MRFGESDMRDTQSWDRRQQWKNIIPARPWQPRRQQMIDCWGNLIDPTSQLSRRTLIAGARDC